MKLCLRLLFLALAAPLPAAPPAGYYQVWSDEFDGPSLNRTFWKLDLGARRDAINTPRSVSCNGSNLVITTFTTNSIHYTAIVTSQDRFVLKYGYLESGINFDDSPGMWSAYWLESPTMGTYIGDPAYAGIEIDVCEHRKVDYNGNNIDGIGQVNLHWDGYGADHKAIGSGDLNAGLGTGFHSLAVQWTDTNYVFLYDGAQRWATSAALSRRSEYILLSAEVLSNSWAGVIPPIGYGDLTTSTTRLYVDYVRYYAPATTIFWQGGVSGSWTNPGNWISGLSPKPTHDIVFSLLSTSNRSTTLDQDYSIRSLSLLETAGSVTIKSNTLTIDSGGIDMVSAMYNLSVRSGLVLGADQTWSVSTNHILHAYGSISGSGNLSLNGYGLVSLYASNAFTGDTRPLRGTLSLKNTNALQNSTLDLDVAGSGTLNLNNLNVVLGGLKGSRPLALGSAGFSVGNNNQNTAFRGTLSGSDPLTKLGVGALALSGSNTYSGGTFINAGVLTASNSIGSATGTDPVTVAPGATLSGPGSLVGPVSVSGTIAPGTAIGTLTTGPQTWNSGGVYAWEVSNPTNNGGWDRLSINGSLNIAATPTARFRLQVLSLTLALLPGPVQGFNNQSNYTWTIAAATGGIASFDPAAFAVDTASFSNSLAGGSFTVEQAGSSVLLKFHPNVIPSRFVQVQASTGKPLLLSAVGVPGKTYHLQSATNLVAPVTWAPFATTNADLNGWFQFVEPPASNDPQKFYRLFAP